jgi:eukaryotic-like serine/threonine-protein kinase
VADEDSDGQRDAGTSSSSVGSGDSRPGDRHVEPLRLHATDEPTAAFAPSGPSAEGDFLAERLTLFARVAWMASGGFLVMRVVLIEASRPAAAGLPDLAGALFFHLVATGILFVLWILARSRAVSPAALRRCDTAATIAAALAYAVMGLKMPLSWRPDQLLLQILNAVLLGRAALVPSEPRRTAWISVASVFPVPIVAYLLFRGNLLRDLPVGAVVTQAVLWATFTVVLATLLSHVTFHLRRSVAHARRLGQYRLMEKIGQGGMGLVYRAEHEMLRRPTAIKLLLPQTAGEITLRRFEREAQQTARLTNPHTVSVYDFGRTPEGAFYYVMEYLDGVDLERLVREEGPLPPGRVVRILDQVCEALAEAHGIGLIHRDVKPGNILLSEWGGVSDFAKVVDFGLVKEVEEPADARLTREDVFPGTLQYLAPETIQGASPDPRSDLYALGAVAYFLLTGAAPFDGKPVAVLQSHLQEPPQSPSSRLGRPLPKKLERLVLECLEKDPNGRPESADALRERLATCDDVEPWNAEEARRWWKRRKTA